MSMYRLPPLHEISAEFQFRSQDPWDMTVPGLLFERLRSQYPQKRMGRRIEVQTRVVDGQVLPVVRDQAGDVQFISPDGKAGLKLDANAMTYQRLNPYPGWTQVRQEILEAVQSYIEIAGPSAFEQLRLHYVNRISLDPSKGNVDISRLLEVWPRVPPRLGSSFGKFLVKIDLPEPKLGARLVVTAGIAENPSGDVAAALILDLDFISVASPLPLDAAAAWLEEAHRRIVDSFELCITDEARLRFEPLI